MGYRSETVNIIRYTNGTLVKITPSADGFVSYDYNPDTNIGTFSPSAITLSVTYGGDLHFGRWEYSTDGEGWTELANGEHGIALNSSLLTVPASCDLFGTTNSQVTFRCVGDNPVYYDTATITREVDALQVYRTTKTQIDQSNDKISLIASDEQLAYFTKSATFYNRYSNFEQTSQGFMQIVQNSYATKLYADEAADDALDDAKAYADGKFVDQTTYTTKMQQTDAAITTQAGQITGLSTEVGTKARTYMQATAPTGAVTGDLWVNTSKNNEVSRYNGSAWVGVVNANAVVSQINQTAEEISINANKINLNGAVSANGNFKITAAGDLEAKNASLSGQLKIGGGSGEYGRLRVYTSNGELYGQWDADALRFYKNGKTHWENSRIDVPTGATCQTVTDLDDGAIRFQAGKTGQNNPYPIYEIYATEYTAGIPNTVHRVRKDCPVYLVASDTLDSSAYENVLTVFPAAGANQGKALVYGNIRAQRELWASCVRHGATGLLDDGWSKCEYCYYYVVGCLVYVRAYLGTQANTIVSQTIASGLPSSNMTTPITMQRHKTGLGSLSHSFDAEVRYSSSGKYGIDVNINRPSGTSGWTYYDIFGVYATTAYTLS